MSRSGIVLVTLMAMVSQAWADGLSLPLSVTEPAGVGRQAEPISGGIPLPAGQFKKDQAFALFKADGKEIACQTAPLVVSADGTLRWVLVDFQDDLSADGTNAYTLKTVAPQAKPATPVKVEQTADALTVNTGKLLLAISKTKPFGLFDSVTLGGKPVISGGAARYTDGFDGKAYTADKPTSIELENAGPMRVTVKVVGRFTGDTDTKMQYIARITAWAGSSRVHVKYSLSNSNPDHYAWRAVSDSTVELKLAGQPAGTILGASKAVEASADGSLAQGLNAGVAGSAKAFDGEKEVWASGGETDQAQGWIAARLGDGAVYAADLYFAENPPRKLAVSKGNLILGGVTERWDNDAKGALPMSGKSRPLPDSTHTSSEYVLDFAAPADPTKLSARCKADREAAYCLAPGSWYLQDTEALVNGKFCTQADEIACYDAKGLKYDKKDIPTKPARAYGGRYFWGPGDAHYDPEEDVVDQLLLMYLRTGLRSYFTHCRAWANHDMDLFVWRSDGWVWKDGGVWWKGHQLGNDPQRPADPVTGWRNFTGTKGKAGMTDAMASDLYSLTQNKGCHCHNWGYGLFEWYCLTGDHDALEAGIDRVEMDYDGLSRANYLKFVPGKSNVFPRAYNRAAVNAFALLAVRPDDPFAQKAAAFMFDTYMKRPRPEPRGMVSSAGQSEMTEAALEKGFVGKQGMEALAASGNTFDPKTNQLTDKAGHSWNILYNPSTWEQPPMAQAMDLYYRLTGNEDAMDWVIANAQAAAYVFYQPHGLLHYCALAVDFPQRGVAKDLATWTQPPGDKWAEHMSMAGFLARFQPDVCARGYSLCGEPFLKQRAYDYWFAGTHRGYNTQKMSPLDRVGMWMNFSSSHDGELDLCGRTLYIWSHPRKDDKPPAAVADLKVTLRGEKATVSFTAPADAGGGKVIRYQVKCSDRPIVDYTKFLELYNKFEDAKVCNWWMATNLAGETAPKAAGDRESFEVTGVPAGATHFAICSFDDSSNRSQTSNVIEAAK